MAELVYEREAAADLIIDTVNDWAPNFKASVLGRMILSPVDLERKFGLVNGDIMHGHMSLDQLWAARPVLGHASHRGPLKGLYMCGAGCHPGGGVSGNPGRNAAREILRVDRAVRDALGNLVTEGTGDVTLAITSGTGTGSPPAKRVAIS